MIKTVIVSLIMCLVEFFVIVAASPMAKPAIVLRFLPEDIREAAKDHPEPAKWKLQPVKAGKTEDGTIKIRS